MFLFSEAPVFQCSCLHIYAPVFRCSCFQMFLFSDVPVFQCSCFPVFLFSNILLFLFQMVLLSDDPVLDVNSCFPVFLSFRCSYFPAFLYSCFQISPVFGCSCFPVFLCFCLFVFLFELILYIPVNNFSVMSGTGLPGLNQY